MYPFWSIREELVVERFDPKRITALKNNLIQLEPVFQKTNLLDKSPLHYGKQEYSEEPSHTPE